LKAEKRSFFPAAFGEEPSDLQGEHLGKFTQGQSENKTSMTGKTVIFSRTLSILWTSLCF